MYVPVPIYKSFRVSNLLFLILQSLPLGLAPGYPFLELKDDSDFWPVSFSEYAQLTATVTVKIWNNYYYYYYYTVHTINQNSRNMMNDDD